MTECRHGSSEDCPGCMQETIDAMAAEVAELKRHAQCALDREALEKLIQRHASAYVARGSAISDSIIAECKASRDALFAVLSTVTSTECGDGK